MKNKNFISALIFCCMFFFTLPVLAQENTNIISSSGISTMEVAPDTVSFSAAIITEDKNLKKAIEQNNKKAQKVYQGLKCLLKPEDQIKTSDFRVNPVYKYDKETRKREIQGYKVSNQVQLHTKQLDEIGNFLQTAIDKGANSINRLTFTVENQEKYCNELLKKAALKAKQKAEAIAETLEVKIVGIKRVSSSCNRPPVRPIPFGTGLMEAKAEEIPIEAGEVNMSARVGIDFLIQN